MNVHDKAHELARAIQESSEFQQAKQAAEVINADPDSKRMLDDFRKHQLELQSRMMSGETPPKEEMEKAEKLYEVISLNLNIRRLMEAEKRLTVVFEDVQKILGESLQDLYK
ncbi:YlbF family regulator [Paenibacillus sp. J2TS4]|uniref:YlbF family regulator n=1 Tax=Paenibacillus sp. J2TS4 TaxID=2807194 RepID=UPI001B1D5F50|nr:YlbF family regulator [Paenibacillus sp. J2TS4]GIP33692.1 UPF0342 protein [Paenibacillus sp. J2TS4]